VQERHFNAKSTLRNLTSVIASTKNGDVRKEIVNHSGQGFINHRLQRHVGHALKGECKYCRQKPIIELTDLQFVIDNQLRDELGLEG